MGGHPKTIELLNGWLKDGSVSDLLDDSRLDGLLTRQWEDYFLKQLLARLTAAERAALTRLSIFQTRLGEDELAYAGVDAAQTARWLDLSLLQRQRGEAQPLPPQMATLLEMLPPAEQAKVQAQTQAPDSYTVHPVVADYLLAQTAADERASLHRWAAVFYGQPFVQMARDHIARSGQSATDEQIEWLARDRDGVVGQMVARTDDMAQARGAMARALDWQRHLFAAGEVDAADEIVIAVYDILARWGERDRAKGLLRRSIDSLDGFGKAVAQGNLATLLLDEGKLAEALAIYEELYETFAVLDAKHQMATALGQMGLILQSMGRFDDGIESSEKAHAISKELENEDMQAMSLHQLSILYHQKEDYTTALAHSQTAEVLARKLNNDQFLAVMLHEQGLIYNRMANAVDSDAARAGHRQQAAERFQDSLAIRHRIGDEAGTGDALGELGKLLKDAGQMNEAIAAFNEALATYRKLGEPVKTGSVLEFLGSVHERQGQYAAALAKYREALALLQQYGSPQQIAIEQNLIAGVLAKMEGG